jgi:hypothetical protein
MDHQDWEIEDFYPPLPLTNRAVIQSWPEHCEQGLGKRDY